jgi:hypothetical protein
MSYEMAGAGASAAAAEQHRREEEEEMTPYTDQDLREGWEFKIVRSITPAFRKADALRRVCEEEAKSGWTLVEKFDDTRLRFKRPAAARARDHASGIDPYRTWYGTSQGALAMAAILAALAVAGVLFAVVLSH